MNSYKFLKLNKKQIIHFFETNYLFLIYLQLTWLVTRTAQLQNVPKLFNFAALRGEINKNVKNKI